MHEWKTQTQFWHPGIAFAQCVYFLFFLHVLFTFFAILMFVNTYLYTFVAWLVSLKNKKSSSGSISPFFRTSIFWQNFDHSAWRIFQVYLYLCNSDLNLNLRSKTSFEITLIILEVMVRYSSQDLGTSLTTYMLRFTFHVNKAKPNSNKLNLQSCILQQHRGWDTIKEVSCMLSSDISIFQAHQNSQNLGWWEYVPSFLVWFIYLCK